MKRIALAALLLMALQALPASSAPLPVDTNPLGEMKKAPGTYDQKGDVAPGNFRLVFLFNSGSVKEGSQLPGGPATGGPQNLLAKGDFAVRITGGFQAPLAPAPASMVAHHPFLDDVKSAADDAGADDLLNGFPADVSNAVSGVAGDVRDGFCPSAGAPALWAYSTTAPATVGPFLPNGPCTTVVNTLLPDGINYSRVVTTWVPGFWVDFKSPAGAAGGQGAFLYKAAYDNEGEAGGNFWETADAVGTGSWSGGVN